MYFLSIFCQISKEIGAVLRGKLVLYTYINFTNKTAKKLSPVIIDSRLWLHTLLPKSVFPSPGEGLKHSPASPEQPIFLCQLPQGGSGRSNVGSYEVLQVRVCSRLLLCHCTGTEKFSDLHSLAFCHQRNEILACKTSGLFCLAAWDLSLISTRSKIAPCCARQQMCIPYTHLGNTLQIK